MIDDRIRWNEKYTADRVCGAGRPAPFLVEALPSLPRGRALDLACGAGRNTLYLAEQGYDVTGVDISDVALERARAEASRRGLSIPWIDADLDSFSLEPGAFDLITCINFLDRRLFTEIPRALRPGGGVVFEALLLDPGLEQGTGSGTRFRVHPNELLDAFRGQGFRVLAYREGQSDGKPTAAIAALAPGKIA